MTSPKPDLPIFLRRRRTPDNLRRKLSWQPLRSPRRLRGLGTCCSSRIQGRRPLTTDGLLRPSRNRRHGIQIRGRHDTPQNAPGSQCTPDNGPSRPRMAKPSPKRSNPPSGCIPNQIPRSLRQSMKPPPTGLKGRTSSVNPFPKIAPGAHCSSPHLTGKPGTEPKTS